MENRGETKARIASIAMFTEADMQTCRLVPFRGYRRESRASSRVAVLLVLVSKAFSKTSFAEHRSHGWPSRTRIYFPYSLFPYARLICAAVLGGSSAFLPPVFLSHPTVVPKKAIQAAPTLFRAAFSIFFFYKPLPPPKDKKPR